VSGPHISALMQSLFLQKIKKWSIKPLKNCRRIREHIQGKALTDKFQLGAGARSADRRQLSCLPRMNRSRIHRALLTANAPKRDVEMPGGALLHGGNLPTRLNPTTRSQSTAALACSGALRESSGCVLQRACAALLTPD
jgi:hypothetical protein